MSDLSAIEKSILEKFLGMESGYVLDFTNRTMQEFILDSTGRDIYDTAYDAGSGSKAYRMRKFWEVESNFVVAKVLNNLYQYAAMHGMSEIQISTCEKYERAVKRLGQDVPVQDLDALLEDFSDKGFSYLRDEIRDSIEQGKPESSIDRLHTYVMKFIHQVCAKHHLPINKDIALPSLLGQYLKHLRGQGLVDSDITDSILKSSISLLDTLNRVRNERSLAHDNPLLNYHESILIFNQVCSAIRFICELEKVVDRRGKAEEEFILPDPDDDLPF